MLTATAAPAAAAPGDLDPTFDGDGKATTSLSSDTDWAYAVAIQGDGKIIAAGIASYDSASDDPDFGLARYNRDGSLDLTFDGDGTVRTNFGFGHYDEAHAVAVQGDGKIVVAGSSAGDFALTRYDRDGSLDTTFDQDGRVTTPPTSGTHNSTP